jgi:hypothetical protein
MARPVVHAVLVDVRYPVGNSRRRSNRRRDADQCLDERRVVGRELERHRAAAFGADQMHALASEVADQRHQIADQHIHRIVEVRRHRRRAAKSAEVDAHDAVMPREMRNPGAPCLSALGETVHEQHGGRLEPRVGVVVDRVEEFVAVRPV